jgi:hypothetical protein
MKFSAFAFLSILVLILTVIAGCGSAPPSTGTAPVLPGIPVTSAQETTASGSATINLPESSPTSIASSPAGTGMVTNPDALNQLMLQNDDFSSVIVASTLEPVIAEKIDPNVTIFMGFQKGSSFECTFDKNAGRAYQLSLMMDSKANASKSYDHYDKYIEKQLQSLSKVPLTNFSFSVGDRSKTYLIQNFQQGSLIYYLIFVRSNIIEVIGLEVPASSYQGDDMIIDLAGRADRKITSLTSAAAHDSYVAAATSDRKIASQTFATSPRSHVVAATAEQRDSNTIIVTYRGGTDAPLLVNLFTEVYEDGGARQMYTIIGPASAVPVKTGSSHRFTGNFSGKNRVKATGTFSDGTVQVILDTFV